MYQLYIRFNAGDRQVGKYLENDNPDASPKCNNIVYRDVLVVPLDNSSLDEMSPVQANRAGTKRKSTCKGV